MSLLSALKQFSDGARQLFDGLQKPVDSAAPQPEQPSAWQRFGVFNFSGNATTAARSDEALRQLSAEYGSEKEVLFPPKTQFKVIDVE